MDSKKYNSLEEYFNRAPDPKRQAQAWRSQKTGGVFEDIITESCNAYKEKGVAIIDKTPEPMKVIKKHRGNQFIAVYTNKAQPDYKGFLDGGRAVVFEAKHTDTDRITQDRVKTWQGDYLERCLQMGGLAFVLVSFGMEHYFRVDWKDFKNLKKLLGHKYATEEELRLLGCEIAVKNGRISFLYEDDLDRYVPNFPASPIIDEKLERRGTCDK